MRYRLGRMILRSAKHSRYPRAFDRIIFSAFTAKNQTERKRQRYVTNRFIYVVIYYMLDVVFCDVHTDARSPEMERDRKLAQNLLIVFLFSPSMDDR